MGSHATRRRARRSSARRVAATESGLMPKWAEHLVALARRAEACRCRSRRRPSATSRTSTPASTEIFGTPAGSTSSRYSALCASKSSQLGIETTRAWTPFSASRSRAPSAVPTSAPVATSTTSGESASASTYAPRRRPDAGASTLRSRIGTSWRESTRQIGPCSSSRIAAHASAASVASDGRITRQVRDRAHRGEVLDRLVRRAVLADRDASRG